MDISFNFFERRKMLIQLHWQYKDRTAMKAQRDINSTKEMRAFVKETKARHPAPKDAQWLACEKGSEYFWMVEEKEDD